jgi:hypothetical protein
MEKNSTLKQFSNVFISKREEVGIKKQKINKFCASHLR